MTRKDFKAMAASIASITDPVQRKLVAEQMANICAASNPRFDYGKFYAACGVI